MSILSIKTQLHSIEHVPGYLVRLAKDNGFSTINDLFYKHEFLALINGKGKKYQDCCNKFGFVAPKRVIKNQLPIHSVRVCPACIQEQGLVKEKWFSKSVYHCDIHSLVLIDRCEHCQLALLWDVELLEGICTNIDCGRQLPKILSIFPDLTPTEIYQCWLAGKWCLDINPKLFFFTTSTKIMQEVGFAFLTSPDSALTYLDMYADPIRDNSLPQSIKKYELYALRTNLNSAWTTLKQIDDFLALPLLSTSGNTSDVVMLVKEFCKITSLDRTNLTRLIHDGYAKQPENRYRVTPDMKLDLTQLFKALSENSVDIDDTSSITELGHLIDKHFQSNSEVLFACLKGVIPYKYRPDETLFGSIFVSIKSVKNFLVNRLKVMPDRILGLAEFETITGLSEVKIKDAISSGLFQQVAKERYDYNQTLFLSEALTLMTINSEQEELELCH